MTQRPNILFILTDQHRKDAIGAYGPTPCRTPNLDQLARTGVTFDQAYTTSPACSPARASIHTGVYPFRHGMQTNIFQHGCMIHELADTPDLLSRRLEQAGYQRGFTGKWHLGYGHRTLEDPRYRGIEREIDLHLRDIAYPQAYRQASSLPSDLGFVGDDFPGHGGGGHTYPQFRDYLKRRGLSYDVRQVDNYCAEVLSPPESTVDYFLTERAIETIDEFRRGNAPFFFMLNYWGPHEPMHVPTAFLDPYRDQDYEPWPSWNAPQADKPRIHNVKRSRADWSKFERHLRFGHAYGSFIDSQIGRLLEHLRASGALDNTVVIFAADHGDSLGIHAGLSDKSFHMYEPTTAIPLIIRDPRGPAEARREARPVNLTDLHATVLDLAGASQPADTHGRSLVPLVRNDQEVIDWPDAVVTEGSGLGNCLFTQRMIRQGPWKYVFNCGDLDELYHLNDDPHELVNRAVDQAYTAQLRAMQERLEAWMVQMGDGVAPQFRALRCHQSTGYAPASVGGSRSM